MYGGRRGSVLNAPQCSSQGKPAEPFRPRGLGHPLWEGRLFAASLRDIFIVAYLSCRGKKKERNSVFLSFSLRAALFR